MPLGDSELGTALQSLRDNQAAQGQPPSTAPSKEGLWDSVNMHPL